MSIELAVINAVLNNDKNKSLLSKYVLIVPRFYLTLFCALYFAFFCLFTCLFIHAL
jgi:hypothetical protein